MATRILLVDPDDDIVAAFARSLARHGFEVLTASNESECVHHVCESAPDVIVLEPATDGTWGRELLTARDVPPIVVVSCRNRSDELRSQPTQWLTKPIGTAELLQAIVTAVQHL